METNGDHNKTASKEGEMLHTHIYIYIYIYIYMNIHIKLYLQLQRTSRRGYNLLLCNINLQPVSHILYAGFML
jgi:hypothetical protein